LAASNGCQTRDAEKAAVAQEWRLFRNRQFPCRIHLTIPPTAAVSLTNRVIRTAAPAELRRTTLLTVMVARRGVRTPPADCSIVIVPATAAQIAGSTEPGPNAPPTSVQNSTRRLESRVLQRQEARAGAL
jgi:hypothetical protein